jgi:hypothetical protein
MRDIYSLLAGHFGMSLMLLMLLLRAFWHADTLKGGDVPQALN